MHFGIFNKDLVGFHVWRQTQTQSTILSFAEEDPNILNPRRNDRGNGEGIFRMEFPLSQWITAIPVRAFGNDILWSRITNYLFGIFSLFGIYYLSRRLFSSSRLALVSLWLLAFTPVFYYYSINPMPDILALTLSIWGLFYFFKWHQTLRRRDLVLMTIMLSLSALCKLPFVFYFSIPGIMILLKIRKGKKGLHQALKEGLIVGAGLIPVAAWYLWVIPQWEGNGIVSGIFAMSEEQRSEFWYYIWFNLRTTMPELVIGIFCIA